MRVTGYSAIARLVLPKQNAGVPESTSVAQQPPTQTAGLVSSVRTPGFLFYLLWNRGVKTKRKRKLFVVLFPHNIDQRIQPGLLQEIFTIMGRQYFVTLYFP